MGSMRPLVSCLLVKRKTAKVPSSLAAEAAPARSAAAATKVDFMMIMLVIIGE